MATAEMLADALKALRHYARRHAMWGTYAAAVDYYYRRARMLRRDLHKSARN